MTSIKSRLTHNSSLIFRIIILLMAIFNFEMLQCCVITGTGCHRGHHISGLTGCCAIVYMGAAILEQQEQQEKVAYKESFPTTVIFDQMSYSTKCLSVNRRGSFSLPSFVRMLSYQGFSSFGVRFICMACSAHSLSLAAVPF